MTSEFPPLAMLIQVFSNDSEEYKENILRHFFCETVDCDEYKNRYKEYERRLYAIEGVAHRISSADYKVAFWRKYISPGRALSISAGFQESFKLTRDIKHSAINILKDYNDYMIQTTRSRRGYTADTPSTIFSEDD
ncbi:hypothetical protein D9757_013568 [Collybiopsis confluens]|uniref:Uncharacterized protein n=1 Tax=Collybiopsis confluens TaxID=2823264 RepID=A0A8H5CRD7_9AGAR|nr:hypothetical protein D9757_013568 [Collybiopsis confluens]